MASTAATKAIPAASELINYNYAVAGHDGTLSDADGTLFIKPCVKQEIDFYESSIEDHPDFADFMPVFLGTLALNTQEPNPITVLQAGEALLKQHNHAAKLDPAHDDHHGHFVIQQDGTVVSDTKAHVCDHHSHGSNGTHSQEPVVIIPKNTQPEFASKVVGKRIKTETAIVLENAAHGFVRPNIMDVKLGVRLYADDATQEKKDRFDKVSAETTHKDFGFRIAGLRVWHGEGVKGEDIDREGYKVYGKEYGRFSVNKDNIVDAFRNYLFCESAGIDEYLGKLITQAFLVDVEKIQKVLESQESEMYSASFLFVYEGDGKALRKAVDEAVNPTAKPTVNDDVDVDNSDDDELDEPPKIYALKVIDFAHAKWLPAGSGSDENSLKGVRSVAKILREIAGPEA